MSYSLPDSLPAAWPAPAFLVLDTETTGFSPRTACVVEVGVALFRAGQYVDGFSSLVRPRLSLDGPQVAEALAVNGLQPRELWAARPFREVVDELHLWLDRSDDGQPLASLPVFAFNMPFDESFMAAEYEAIGLRSVIPWAGCIAKQAQDRLPKRQRGEKRRLGDLAARYGIDTGDAHRALDDSITAGRLCLALGAA